MAVPAAPISIVLSCDLRASMRVVVSSHCARLSILCDEAANALIMSARLLILLDVGKCMSQEEVCGAVMRYFKARWDSLFM